MSSSSNNNNLGLSNTAAAWIGVGLTAATLIIQMLGGSKFEFVEPWLKILPWLVPALQAAAILFLLFAGFTAKDFPEDGDLKPAVEATRQFRKFWRLVWMCFFTFYLIASISAAWQQPQVGVVAPYLLDILNVGSSFFVYLCYLVLSVVTVGTNNASYNRGWLIGGVVAVALIVMSAIARFNSLDYYYYGALLGLAGAIALGLFVGRLESPYFGSPRWKLVALYTYAALQVAYPLVEADGTARLVIFMLAFPLKVLLFLEVRRAIKRGWLTHYMYAHRSLLGTIKDQRSEFLKRAKDSQSYPDPKAA